MEDLEFYLEEAKDHMEKSLSHVSHMLAKIRAGRAMPSMLDGLMVEYYGNPTPINQVASVNTPDAKTLAIKPSEIKNIKSVVSRKSNQIKSEEKVGTVNKKIHEVVEKNKSMKSQEIKQVPEQELMQKEISTKPLGENIQKTIQTQPQLDNKTELIINNAFNNLIQKMKNLTGDEFSIELQKIADLILEKRGFSILLHQLSQTINKYKTSIHMLNDNEIAKLIDEIDSWKSKLFQV